MRATHSSQVRRRPRPIDARGVETEPLEINVSGGMLRLQGALDRQTCDHLAASLAEIVDSSVVVDVTDIDSLDEAGVRVLVMDARKRTEVGCGLFLVHPSETVTRRLETLGLLDFFNVGRTPPASLASGIE